VTIDRGENWSRVAGWRGQTISGEAVDPGQSAARQRLAVPARDMGIGRERAAFARS